MFKIIDTQGHTLRDRYGIAMVFCNEELASSHAHYMTLQGRPCSVTPC